MARTRTTTQAKTKTARKASAVAATAARLRKNTQRDAFVEKLVACGDGLMALEAAGYKKPTDDLVEKLLADPKVRIAMYKLQSSATMSIDKKFILERIRRVTDLTGQATLVDGKVQLVNLNGHLRCLDMLARHSGFFRDEKENGVLDALIDVLRGAPDPEPDEPPAKGA